MEKEIETKEDFKEIMYSNPTSYNDKFSNDIANQENEEIRRILKQHIPNDATVHDIGCGTGLGRELLGTNFKGDYYGLDSILESIVYCRENVDGIFLYGEAETFIENKLSVNPLFIFSADYMPIETLEAYIQKTEDVFIAVHYNEPFLSETSYYSGKEATFYDLHPVEAQREKLSLFERYNGETFRLLDQDYYYVTIIKGNESGRTKV